MRGGSSAVRGRALDSAELTVDVASITPDSGRRDGWFRDSALDVGTHPTATFTVTGPVDLPELTGTPASVPVTGELTVAGQPRQVEVDLSVVRTPGGGDVSGSIPVTFTDHGIEGPDLGFVRVEDQGAIEFLLHLTM